MAILGYIATGVGAFILGIGTGVFLHWRYEMKGIADLWGW